MRQTPDLEGLSTFPEALGVVAGAQIADQVYPRFGPRRMLTVEALGITAVTALLVTVGPGTSLWWVRALMLLLGLSWAQAFGAAADSRVRHHHPPATGPPPPCSTSAASSAGRPA